MNKISKKFWSFFLLLTFPAYSNSLRLSKSNLIGLGLVGGGALIAHYYKKKVIDDLARQDTLRHESKFKSGLDLGNISWFLGLNLLLRNQKMQRQGGLALALLGGYAYHKNRNHDEYSMFQGGLACWSGLYNVIDSYSNLASVCFLGSTMLASTIFTRYN